MIKTGKRLSLLALVGILSIADCAYAGRLMDYIRSYDLNDYAFGVALSRSQSPYSGGEDSTFAYPFLTSFRDSAFTDDWFLIREGDMGFRWVSEGGWELGVVGRIQTDGLGTSDAPQLRGLDERKWTVELAPIIGWRGWPVHINYKIYTEVLDRHEGLISQLAFSLPYEHDRGYVVPSIELIYRDQKYTDYYYGVSAAEALPTRPEYQAGDSLNTAFKIRWGYAVTDKWLLSGDFGLELLDTSITDSPIVGEDRLLSTSISLAYNANIFQPRASNRTGPRQPRFEIRLGAFSDNVDSKIVRESTAGVPGSEIDLDEILGISTQETVMQLDTIFRIGNYHRLEIGYFEMSRTGLTVLQEPVTIGEEDFAAGTTLESSFNSEILRFGYAYSLMNDDQKELGVMAGMHYSKFNTVIVDTDSGQRAESSATTPLPVIGLHGSVALGQKMTLGARIQIFRMDFDRFEGSMNYATLDLQRHFGENFSVGLGYNYYALKLISREDSSRGSLEVRHQGPVLFLSSHF
jgi:outer membrane protein